MSGRCAAPRRTSRPASAPRWPARCWSGCSAAGVMLRHRRQPAAAAGGRQAQLDLDSINFVSNDRLLGSHGAHRRDAGAGGGGGAGQHRGPPARRSRSACCSWRCFAAAGDLPGRPPAGLPAGRDPDDPAARRSARPAARAGMTRPRLLRALARRHHHHGADGGGRHRAEARRGGARRLGARPCRRSRRSRRDSPFRLPSPSLTPGQSGRGRAARSRPPSPRAATAPW